MMLTSTEICITSRATRTSRITRKAPLDVAIGSGYLQIILQDPDTTVSCELSTHTIIEALRAAGWMLIPRQLPLPVDDPTTPLTTPPCNTDPHN